MGCLDTIVACQDGATPLTYSGAHERRIATLDSGPAGPCSLPAPRGPRGAGRNAWRLGAAGRRVRLQGQKAGAFPFMDFSTLPLRRRACEAEIRVNRRFQSHDQPATSCTSASCPLWARLSGLAGAKPVLTRRRRSNSRCRCGVSTNPSGWTTCATTAPLNAGAHGLAGAAHGELSVARGGRGPNDPLSHPAAAMRWPRDNFTTCAACSPSRQTQPWCAR